MNWATRLDRAVSLARYHRPQQFFYRALRMAQRRLPSRSLHRSLDRLGPAKITDDAEGVLRRMAERRLQLWPARHDVEWLESMSRGEFRFLNRTGTRSEQHTMPRLWRFHLQSQESLLELAAHVGAEHAWRLVGDWLAEYPSPGRDADAWHPFCISRRLPVWLMLAARHGVPDSLEQDFWTSVHRQTFWLSRNLEWDLGGNHLMENLRTLFVAKAVLEPRTRVAEADGRAERGTTTNDTNNTNGQEGERSGEDVAELAESFGQPSAKSKGLATSATEPSPAATASNPPEGRVKGPKVLATSATDRTPNVLANSATGYGGLCDYRHEPRWLLAQIDEQILPTGEHYERAPTYHALMLLSLMEIDDVLPLIAPRDNRVRVLAAPLRKTIAKMQAFLASIVHPDGMIPLFGDSVVDETPLPAVLISPMNAKRNGTLPAPGIASGEMGTTTNDTDYTNGLSGTALAAGPDAGVTEHLMPEASVDGSQETDYWVDRSPVGHWQKTGPSPCPSPPLFAARRGRAEFEESLRDHSSRFLTEPHNASCLIFDHGHLACDHLPAHGHADLLTFEASWGGRRLIIDRGTYDYEDSLERQLCRGTSGHNTLQIDGVDHADIWSRFRMGRRGRVTEVRRGSDADCSWCLASHDAYARIGVPRVVRLIMSGRTSDAAGPAWLIVDIADASAQHEYRSPLHVHPDWNVLEAERRGSWLCGLTGSPPVSPLQSVGSETDQRVRIAAIAGQSGVAEQVGLEESFYAPNFGERIANIALARRWKAEGLTWSGWLIGPEHVKTIPAVTVSRDAIRVEWYGRIWEWRVVSGEW